jgi:hypothetical protein
MLIKRVEKKANQFQVCDSHDHKKDEWRSPAEPRFTISATRIFWFRSIIQPKLLGLFDTSECLALTLSPLLAWYSKIVRKRYRIHQVRAPSRLSGHLIDPFDKRLWAGHRELCTGRKTSNLESLQEGRVNAFLLCKSFRPRSETKHSASMCLEG